MSGAARELEGRIVESDEEWVAAVFRSSLDRTVWVPWYGADRSCFEWPGRLGAVKRHVEAWAPRPDGVEVEGMMWWPRDRDTWWWIPRDPALR